MAKDVLFNIKLNIDGKEQVVTASTNVKQLAEQLGIARTKVKALNDAMFFFNQMAEAARNASAALQQLSDHMAGVVQQNARVTQLTGKTGDEMLRLKSSAQAVADTFGADFNSTLQAANSLSKAFGISADEAMRLVRDGFVSGADANGDFVDTLREYPRYFKEAGLSAEQFVAIATNAAKQGIYSDKGVDAIKEGNLRIREMTTATAAALEGIGISAQRVQQGLRDGSVTTFQVMQQVAARLRELPASSAEVGAALADIFGGPGEDAGLEYIKTLSDVKLNMDEVKAASGQVAEQLERQVTVQEKLQRLKNLFDLSGVYATIQPAVVAVGQLGMALSAVTAAGKGIRGLTGTVKKLAASIKAATVASTAFGTASRAALLMTGIGAAIAGVVAVVAALTDGTGKAAEKMQELKEAEDAFTSEAARIKVELDKEIASLGKLITAKADTAGAVRHLNETYGQAFGVYKTAADWYDVLTRKSAIYAQQKGYEAQAEELSMKIAQKENQIDMNAEKQRVMKEAGVENMKTTGNFLQDLLFNEDMDAILEYRNLKEEAQKLNDELNELIKERGFAEKRLAEKTKELLAGLNLSGTGNGGTGNGGGGKITIPVTLEPDYDPAALDEAAEAYIPKAVEQLNTIKELTDAIAYYRDLQQTQGAEESMATQHTIDLLERKLALRRQLLDVPAIEAQAVELDGLQGQDYEIRLRMIGIDQVRRNIDTLKAAMQSLSADQQPAMKALIDKWQGYEAALGSTVQKAPSVQENLSIITGALSQVGNAVGEGAGQWLQWGTNLLAAIGAAIPAIASLVTAKNQEATAASQSAVSKAADSVAGIPFVGAILAAAAAASVIAAIAKAPKFAEGGLAYGPTLGLFGEYPGAGSNPEVVAPLDRLRSLLEPSPGLNGEVRFVIDGDKLVGVLNRRNRQSSRS